MEVCLDRDCSVGGVTEGGRAQTWLGTKLGPDTAESSGGQYGGDSNEDEDFRNDKPSNLPLWPPLHLFL